MEILRLVRFAVRHGGTLDDDPRLGVQEMTKQEWLKRCETIYDLGLVKDRGVSVMLRLAADTYLRLRHCYALNPERFEYIKLDHQGSIVSNNLELYLDTKRTLAADKACYDAEVMASIIDHPCQFCAEDKNAWHTRYGFCDHKKERGI